MLHTADTGGNPLPGRSSSGGARSGRCDRGERRDARVRRSGGAGVRGVVAHGPAQGVAGVRRPDLPGAGAGRRPVRVGPAAAWWSPPRAWKGMASEGGCPRHRRRNQPSPGAGHALLAPGRAARPARGATGFPDLPGGLPPGARRGRATPGGRLRPTAPQPKRFHPFIRRPPRPPPLLEATLAANLLALPAESSARAVIDARSSRWCASHRAIASSRTWTPPRTTTAASPATARAEPSDPKDCLPSPRASEERERVRSRRSPPMSAPRGQTISPPRLAGSPSRVRL